MFVTVICGCININLVTAGAKLFGTVRSPYFCSDISKLDSLCKDDVDIKVKYVDLEMAKNAVSVGFHFYNWYASLSYYRSVLPFYQWLHPLEISGESPGIKSKRTTTKTKKITL